MNSNGKPESEHSGQVYLYALQTLAPNEASAFEVHLSECADCRKEYEAIKPIVASFVSWPTDVLRPGRSLWKELSRRIAEETGGPVLLEKTEQSTINPEWEEAAPGLSVKILATEFDRDRVSMLVRLAPGTDYPAHRHAGSEELYLLAGELIIDEKTLYPGDYYRAEAGTIDHRVWSETGCTCLLITSPNDVIL